jgi:heat shock protein HtpX
MGNLKVFFLMAAMTAIFVVVGGWIGGSGGMLIAFAVAAALNFFAWFNSASAALRAFRARIVSREEARELHDLVDELRQRAGLPMPRLAIAPQSQPNAFATGRSREHSVVCVTDGLLKVLDRQEVRGVIAHELAHIRNGDMLLQTFSATLAGAVGLMSQIGMRGGDGRPQVNPLALLLAPLAATVIQFAVSRSREFKADEVGARISGKPLDLAAALAKINDAAKRIPMAILPSMAPVAQVDPLQAFGGGIGRMFSTHPPVEERIARLRTLAREGVASIAAE